MTDVKVPVVVITGPIGVGKTTISQQIGHLLTALEVPHTVIDMDWLRDTWPQPPDDRFNSRLGLSNLADVARNSMEVGSERFVIADVVESRHDYENYRRAIPGASVHVVRLTADMEVNRERISRRANGVEDPWEAQRAAELVDIMDANDVADLIVDTTGRTPDDIAREVATRLGWLPGKPTRDA